MNNRPNNQLDNAASKLKPNGLLTVSVNGGVALKTWYSVMVDTWSMFVELKSTTLVLGPEVVPGSVTSTWRS